MKVTACGMSCRGTITFPACPYLGKKNVGSAALAVHQGVPQDPLHQLTIERQGEQLFG